MRSDDASVSHYPYSWTMPQRSSRPRHLNAMAVALATVVPEARGGTGDLGGTESGGCRTAVTWPRLRVTVEAGQLPVGV